MFKRKDLVIHRDSNAIATVLKTYINNDSKEEYVQALGDTGIIYGKAKYFRPMDSLLLKCSNCSKESYEIDLDLNKDNGMYVCECGSSTFTPLNLELENY